MYMPRFVDVPLAPQLLVTNWSDAAFAGSGVKIPRQAAKMEQTAASFLVIRFFRWERFFMAGKLKIYFFRHD